MNQEESYFDIPIGGTYNATTGTFTEKNYRFEENQFAEAVRTLFGPALAAEGFVAGGQNG